MQFHCSVYHFDSIYVVFIPVSNSNFTFYKFLLRNYHQIKRNYYKNIIHNNPFPTFFNICPHSKEDPPLSNKTSMGINVFFFGPNLRIFLQNCLGLPVCNCFNLSTWPLSNLLLKNLSFLSNLVCHCTNSLSKALLSQDFPGPHLRNILSADRNFNHNSFKEHLSLIF